jgi:HK97 family phage portal protein
VLETWNIAPERVRLRRENQRIVYDIFDPDHDLMVTVGQDRMFHIPGLSWPGKLKGISPLEAARHLVGAGLGSQEYAERFYGQGMHQSGVIEAEDDLTIEQAKEVKQDFQRITGGLRKAHLPAVLVKAKWNPMTVSPEQAQFLETRAFSGNEIARFFRVPPHMIADVEKSTSWGTGIEQQGIGFVTYTLAPWLTRLEQAYSTFLLNRPFQRNAFVKFNVNGLMRGDIKTRFETYQIARQNGLMNADEIRALEDQPPLPDGAGEEYWRPANIGVVGEEQTDPGPDAAPPEGLT